MARVARRLSWFVANVVEQLLQVGYGSEKACQIFARRSGPCFNWSCHAEPQGLTYLNDIPVGRATAVLFERSRVDRQGVTDE
jgi:hypothetical protein